VILNTSSAYRDVRTTDNKEQQRYLPGAEKPSLPLRADPRIEFQEQRVDQASKHDADETDKTPRPIARRLEKDIAGPRRSAATAGIAMQPYFAAVAQLQTFQRIRRLIGCFKLI
jgi:hypothetical protein